MPINDLPYFQVIQLKVFSVKMLAFSSLCEGEFKIDAFRCIVLQKLCINSQHLWILSYFFALH
jgi:hypothetical protein